MDMGWMVAHGCCGHGLAIGEAGGIAGHHGIAGLETGEDLGLVIELLAGLDQAQRGAVVPHHKHRLDLAAPNTARRGTNNNLVSATGTATRPNWPGRRPGSSGRSSLTMNVRLTASATGEISETVAVSGLGSEGMVTGSLAPT